MNKNTYILILFSLIMVPPASAMVFEHSQFDQILRAYIDDQGLVDYNAIVKDPRIHFAIVCASSRCPKLARFAFNEEQVQRQLEEETRKYLISDRRTRIDYAENTLYLSKLFDWFAGDFESTSGSVLALIKPYLKEDAMIFLERKPKIEYLSYNCASNAKSSIK